MTTLKEAYLKHEVVINNLGEEVIIYGTTSVPIVDKKEKTASIQIKTNQATHFHTGHIGITNEIFPIIEQAANEKRMVALLFEQRRKKTIPGNIPIEEVKGDNNLAQAKKNTIKILTGVYDFNNKKWIYSFDASFTEETETMKQWVHNSEGHSYENFFEEKAKPIKTTELFDKQQHLIMFYHNLKNTEYGKVMTDEELKKSSETLLKLSGLGQLYSTGANEINMKDYTHTRARGMVLSIVETTYPLNEEYVKNQKQWAADIYTQYKNLVDWANQV